MVRSAVERGDLSDFGDVERLVLDGRALLWLACEGTDIRVAVVTAQERTEKRLVCTILACAGSGMDGWLHLLELIEDYARAEGCAAVRLFGRKGWQRKLAEYRTKLVVMEKTL
jgi:hypothetical protein